MSTCAEFSDQQCVPVQYVVLTGICEHVSTGKCMVRPATSWTCGQGRVSLISAGYGLLLLLSKIEVFPLPNSMLLYLKCEEMMLVSNSRK